MKIGYLVPEFPGQTHGFFWNEIQHFERVGHEVEIFSTRKPKNLIAHSFSEKARDRTLYLADFRVRDLFSWVRAAFIGLRLMVRPNIRALNRAEGESFIKLIALAIVGARLSIICRSKGIQHIHGHSCADVAYVTAFSKLVGGPDYSLSLHGDISGYGRNHAFKFAHAKFVACVSTALREEMVAQFTCLAGRFEMVSMGIECDRGTRKAADSWSPVGSLKIVTVSRLHRMKGHAHAIAAVRTLICRGYEIRYDIIGDGDFRDEIALMISRAGMGDHIHLVGTVPNDQVQAVLCHYDAFVLPSLAEATPVAIMEAMGAGLPSICSMVGGIPDMLAHGKTGYLVAAGDEAGLIDILAALADHPGRRKQIGEQARDFVHANFLTSIWAAKLLDLIQK